MNEMDVLQAILERIEFMKENMNDLDIEERIMQLQIILTDMQRMPTAKLHKIVAAELMQYAAVDDDCHIHFSLMYPKQKEEGEDHGMDTQ